MPRGVDLVHLTWRTRVPELGQWWAEQRREHWRWGLCSISGKDVDGPHWCVLQTRVHRSLPPGRRRVRAHSASNTAVINSADALRRKRPERNRLWRARSLNSSRRSSARATCACSCSPRPQLLHMRPLLALAVTCALLAITWLLVLIASPTPCAAATAVAAAGAAVWPGRRRSMTIPTCSAPSSVARTVSRAHAANGLNACANSLKASTNIICKLLFHCCYWCCSLYGVLTLPCISCCVNAHYDVLTCSSFIAL